MRSDKMSGPKKVLFPAASDKGSKIEEEKPSAVVLTEQEQLEKEIEEEIKLPTIGLGLVNGDASRQQPIIW